MINWIIGGGIIAMTIFIIVKMFIQMRKGGSSCCGGDCTSGKDQCQCNCTHKP